MKIIKREITRTWYVAEDGTEFESECNCINYELEMKQDIIEKEVDDKLRIYTPNSNFPTMLDLKIEKEFRLFLIKNEEDLDLFIKTYDYWFTDLERKWEVSKEVFVYPNVLCILDFPHGDDDHRLYNMRQLCNQFYAFENEMLNEIELKLNENSEGTK